jgi:hypothetical protein
VSDLLYGSPAQDAVVFFHQARVAGEGGGAAAAAPADDPFAADPEAVAATGRTLTFLRVTPAGAPVPEAAPDAGLAAIELLPESGGEAASTTTTATTTSTPTSIPSSSLLPAAKALVLDLMAAGAGGSAAPEPADAAAGALIDGALKVSVCFFARRKRSCGRLSALSFFSSRSHIPFPHPHIQKKKKIKGRDQPPGRLAQSVRPPPRRRAPARRLIYLLHLHHIRLPTGVAGRPRPVGC